MKTTIRPVVMLAIAAAALSVAHAAEEKPAAQEEKGKMRVLAAPDRERRVVVQHAERQPLEMETVAFLGVEASPVSATTSAQLSLPRGTGLVVNNIVPKSAAGDVLKIYDILLKLDDQILIEVRQLSVLIRNHNEGDEVTLTYLRGGQKATAKVKLGKQEVPKMNAFFAAPGGARAFAYASGGDGKIEMVAPGPDGLEGHEEWDRVLGLLQRARPAADAPAGFVPRGARIRIDHNGGPGVRAMSINTGNSNLVYSDDDGSLELTIKDGAKNLVAKNTKGEQVFAGPVSTPAEREALPDGVRERLEKLEGMHDVTFRTDGDFKSGETQVFRPRGIALPLLQERRLPRSSARFY